MLILRIRFWVLHVIAATNLLIYCHAARGDDKLNTDLRQELLERMNRDQELRKQALNYLEQNKGTDAAELKSSDASVAVAMRENDERNTVRLKEIVDQYGWPGKSLVGRDGSHAAWLLVQHADHDLAFQKRCLLLITEAVKQAEASPTEMAYLTDRVCVAEKRKQMYGTQFTEANGNFEPHPIQDEANVDKRRKDVGLSSLDEYRKDMESLYRPKAAKP